jgi:hypothetical protein
MEFELKRLPEYTDQAILSELVRVAGLVGSSRLTILEFAKHSKVNVSTLRKRFGSWPMALEAAGLAHLYNRPAPAQKSRTLARTLSDDELIAEIRRVALIVDRCELTKDDLHQHAVVGPSAFRNRFGSLKAALRAAGLIETAHGRRYTDEECFENLLVVWTHYGRPPQYREMNHPPSTVGPKAYVGRWKTWHWALEAFVDRVNRENDESAAPPASQRPGATTPNRTDPLPEEEQHHVKLGLRYKVLVRDRFRCVQCGSSPATNLDCSLHVDHIVPWSKGGKTVLENLQALCERCNLGKGDRYVT